MRDQFYQPPTERQIEHFAKVKSITKEAAEKTLLLSREKKIKSMRVDLGGDPYRYGYEPPIWYIAKALLRNYEPLKYEMRGKDGKKVVYCPDEETVKKATGLAWEEFCQQVRSVLGFAHPVGELLIMGANRSGKTDFAAKFANQIAMQGSRSINIGMQTIPTGKQVQMPRVWNYLPKELKEHNIAGKKSDNINEHISYTKQNGFSSSKITFANKSEVRFISYDMDVTSAMEGSALDMCWLDEEFTKAFLDAARFRLASKRGMFIGTFTPISGYTPVVADYLSSMQVTKWHTAYMLPRDGKDALPFAELGLEREEYLKLKNWRDAGGKDDPGIVEARPENCFKWVLKGEEKQETSGRSFAKTPRVAVCKGGEAAAIWFYGSDNPYGMPGEVIENALKNINAIGMIKKRVYGIAEKIKGRMFPEFTRAKNVVRDSDIPRKLVRIMVVDPAPERNWTAGWYGYDPQNDILYKYRDWPGNYEVPGVGVPGPWAVASDRKNGVNDGEKGEGQEPFGMGFLHYKFEWARLEGWEDFKKWVQMGNNPLEWPENIDIVEEWSEIDGVDEPMEFRLVDSRAASQSKIHNRENVTLFDDVSRLAEGFQMASGQRIDVGINYLRDRITTGRYRISENCTNTIFAYETYCGVDGQKGACKDFVDCDRYAILSELCELGAEHAKERGIAMETVGAKDRNKPLRFRGIVRRGAGGRRF